MRESAIESALVRRAKELGIYTAKFTSPSRRGVPDRIFIYKGVVLFLELKAPGEKPTKLQMHEMQELDKQGATVTWTDSLYVGKELLRALQEGRAGQSTMILDNLKINAVWQPPF